MKLFYAICKMVSRIVFLTYFRSQAFHSDKVPLEGRLILAGNHASFLDPPLIGSMVKRRVYFLARQSLFKLPIIRQALHGMNAIPVDRDGRSGAGLKVALKTIEREQCLVLFPEGTRSLDGARQPVKSGLGMMVVKTKCRVTPVRVVGTQEAYGRTQKFPRPKKVSVHYGDLLDFTDFIEEAQSADTRRQKEIYQEISDTIMDAIFELPARGQ